MEAPASLARERAEVELSIERALPGLESFFGDSLAHDYVVTLAPTPAAFVEAVGGNAPAWALGITMAARKKVVLLSARSAPAGTNTGQIAVHEVVHLFVHERSGGMVPRWLNEGIAVYLSGEDRGASFWDLAKAIYTENALFLDELARRFPAGEESARLAYYESLTAVQFIVRTWGAPSLRDLLDETREYGFDAALRAQYGLSRDEFEYEWYRDLRKRTRWVVWVGNGLPFAMIVTVLFGAASVRRWIKSRRKISEWDREETERRGAPPA